MADRPVQRSLSPEQLAFYRREGCLVIPDLLSEEDMIPQKQSMRQKVSMIVEEFFTLGCINDMLENHELERLSLLQQGRNALISRGKAASFGYSPKYRWNGAESA